MKYRLGKNLAKNGFREYLNRHLFVLSELSRKLGISNNALYDYLDGKIKKPRREILEKIAEITNTNYSIDDTGIYFEAFPEVLSAEVDEALPFFDDQHPERMDAKERNQVIAFINKKFFGGKMPIEKQRLLDEIFKLKKEKQEIVLEIMKNIAKL